METANPASSRLPTEPTNRSSLRKKYRVSAERFCLTYIDCETLDEVAAKLDMPVRIVSARAAQYRALGINIPIKPRRAPSHKLRVAEINRRIMTAQESRN